MVETEVKILGINERAVESRLKALGARKIFDGRIDGLALDFPDGVLWKSGALLRLRKRGKNSELTFKRVVSGKRTKRAVEIETDVSDFARAKRIFEALGLVEKWRISKHRTSYKLGKAEIEIDKLPGIPAYLEIEAESFGEIRRIAERLGFGAGELKPWSMRDVIAHYSKK
ncbi:MAG: class IV adenylate cyclase [archaeon]